MFAKFVVSFMSFTLFVMMTACALTIVPAEVEDTAPEKAVQIVESVVESQPAASAASTVAEESQSFLETPATKVLFTEMTLVELVSETNGWADTVCAGQGLNNVNSWSDKSIILIPNAGDLAVEGSTVAIQLDPDGGLTFIPRVQGQRILMPMDVGEKKAGQEVESLALDEAMALMAADKLIWTARDQGPYGNGHGLSGHIALCDPLNK